MALNTSTLKFSEQGYIAINPTGGTVSGSYPLGLVDYSLAFTNDNIEIQHIEDNFVKSYVNTSSSWTMSLSGNLVDASGSTAMDAANFALDAKLSAGTKKTTNAIELLEVAKTKGLVVGVVQKIKNNNFQVGQAIITSFNIDSSVGAVRTFSMELQGVGALTKATA